MIAKSSNPSLSGENGFGAIVIFLLLLSGLVSIEFCLAGVAPS